MQHWLKVLALLFFTLLVMRALSWVALWLTRNSKRLSGWKGALALNAIAFAAFLGFLRTQAVPGEFVDPAAAIFGAVVYSVFMLVDVFWVPWKRG